ncbi:MAG: 1-aminocyclopropane-1-carboxylate deaminase/D-cysteine desulfhydrase [Cyclobacteriaceae bacterium]
MHKVSLLKTDYSRIQLSLLREDLLHPTISGNKWRKLKYNLIQAKKQGHHTLLTFGGAYSNHIHATAAAGKEFEFKTIGLIRGEKHLPLNPTLQQAQSWGMQLHYVSRNDYKNKDQPQFIKALKSKFGQFYLLPEGGTNNLALEGCAEMVKVVETTFDYWCVPCGTGGTMAGIVKGLNGRSKVIGFSALKDGGSINRNVDNLLAGNGSETLVNWEINVDNHFGGYAKFTPELINFVNQFKAQHQIQLDPIYTGKMMLGIFKLATQGFFPVGTRILAVHTGGKQGIKGFNQRNGNIID